MNKLLLILLVPLLGTLWAAWAFHPGVADDDTRVIISPAAGSYQQGDIFEVGVVIENVTDLYTMDIRLAFDPDLLHVVENQVTPGNLFFPADVILFNTVDNQAGEIMYVATMLNPSPPVSGSGIVFSFHFEARAGGEAAVAITLHDLVKTGAVGIPNTPHPAAYTLLAPALYLPLLQR